MTDSNRMTGFSYFGRDEETGEYRSWNHHITRDERFFCAHLYRKIQENGVKGFVELVSETCELDLDSKAYWELGYEVCFYRDIGLSKIDDYSPKRTFDLCLFSEKTIVIIEAKAHQCFDSAQLKDCNLDKIEVGRILRLKEENVHLIGLISSLYSPAKKTKGIYFDDVPFLEWKKLAIHYENDEIFQRADKIYNQKPSLIIDTPA